MSSHPDTPPPATSIPSITLPVDTSRRRFLTGATVVVGAAAGAGVAWPFLSSWQPSERARAIGAPIEMYIGKLEPGGRITGKWRGKPVWVVRRTPESLSELGAMADKLRDPGSEEEMQPSYAQNAHRSIKDEYLVLVGICTHLGCSPLYHKATDSHSLGDEWKGGFFCPCHGSKFDLAGRVYKGVPAPSNLEVPPYRYVSDSLIIIGEDPTDAEAAA